MIDKFTVVSYFADIVHVGQIVSAIGDKLEVVDLNGGLMTSLTDEGVSSIVRHCPRLTNVSLSLNRNITGTTLIPLLEDVGRAERLTRLHLSLKQASFHLSLCVIEGLIINGHMDSLW